MVKRIAATCAQIIVMFLGLTFALLNSRGMVDDIIYRNGELGFIPLIILALLLVLVTIEVISVVGIEGATVHTVLVSLSLFANYFCSIDTQNVFMTLGLRPDAITFDVLHFLFFLCILLSTLYFINYNYKIGIQKPFARYIILCAVGAFSAYIPLAIFKLQYIAFFAYLLTFSAAMIKIYSNVFKGSGEDSIFYLSMTIIYVAVGMQAVDILNCCGGLTFVPYGYPSMHIFVIICLFIAVYFAFISRTSKEACKASEYKLQLEQLKTRVLREQINPHFMFNTLTAIKSLYHRNLDDGDNAINLFSRHLRANVEAFDKDLVPFENELDMITTFVELQNLKYTSPFKIVYDIACDDFKVPLLSLQVFVENAIKYSKVNQKPDGYIEISSYEEGENIILEVNDNGQGFDTQSIKDDSYGIKNARERFRLLLGADVQITSEKDKGTSVKITFKRQN